jgi:hypothetical protein
MTTEHLSQLKTEVTALATFLKNYDDSVNSFYSGAASCTHFSEVIDTLLNEVSSSLAISTSQVGDNTSLGALVDFVQEIEGIKRSKAILASNKASYYAKDVSSKALDAAFNSGEVTRLLSDILGSSTEQRTNI